MIPLPLLAFLKSYGQYIALAIALVGGYLWIDYHWATAAGIKQGRAEVQADFDKFKINVAQLGKEAKIEADRRIAAEKAAKEKSDVELKNARSHMAIVDANLVRERGKRTSGGYVPAPSPTARHPERVAFDRAKFNGAMGYLDERGQGIARAGDGHRVGLDSLKKEPGNETNP